jgi:hypothetical protein
MKGIIVSSILASDVSARVKALIAHNDGGSRSAAARALGVDLESLGGLLSGDWRRFSLDALAALVRGYGVSPAWLLAPIGTPEPVGVRRDSPKSASRRARDEHAQRGLQSQIARKSG